MIFSSPRLFYILLLVIHAVMVWTWYYKPPWMIDHLIYNLISVPENLADLSFWHNSGVSVLEGHHNERWAVIIPINLVVNLLTHLTPGNSSAVLVYFIVIGTLITNTISINKIFNKWYALSYLSISVFGIHHLKNRATEVLADPFGVLYISIAILILALNNEKINKWCLFWVGFFATLAIFTKVHYGSFYLLLLAYIALNNKDKIYAIKNYIYGSLFSVVFMIGMLYVLYPSVIFTEILKNSVVVLSGYITGGLGVSDNGNGWAMEWVSLFSKFTFYPLVFTLSFIYIFNNFRFDINNIYSYMTSTFFLLIFLLSGLSNFPANDSYAYPLYVFGCIPFIVLLFNRFDEAQHSNLFYIFLASSILPLLFIYLISSPVPNSKFITSLSAFVIAISFMLFFFLIDGKYKIYNLYFYPILLIVLSSNLLLHNWKNIENHSWWRDGYNWHYMYLDAASKIIPRNDIKLFVNFHSWPYIKSRKTRELMYIEPGLKSYFRNTLDIQPLISSDKFEVSSLSIGDYLLTDYLVNDNNLTFVDKSPLELKRGFESIPVEYVFLYKKI